jgi:transcriptional regulator with XRE-family HTH domain
MADILPPKKGYGPRIKEAREGAGFTQKQLSECLGWSAETNSNARISGYENESREPSIADFERIAEACNVEPAWLVFARTPKRRKVAA